MTNSARSLARLAGSLSHRFKVASLALIACAVVLACATPAEASVSTFGETTVGLQPRNDGIVGEGSTASFGNEAGDAVVHGANIYSVYWDPENIFHEHQEWLNKIDHFMQQLGASSGHPDTIYGALAQYRDRSNVGASDSRVWKGSYHDFAKYPTTGNCADPNPLLFGAITCLTDAQLREQLQTFIASHGLPKGMDAIYYLSLPPGVTVCVDGSHTAPTTRLRSGTGKRTQKHELEKQLLQLSRRHQPGQRRQGRRNTILYAAIPGPRALGRLSRRLHLRTALLRPGYDCQDGGWNPENELKRESREEPGKAEEEVRKAKRARPKRKSRTRKEDPARRPAPAGAQPGRQRRTRRLRRRSDRPARQPGREEQANMVTDPLLTRWQDGTGNEVTDICRNFFATPAQGRSKAAAQADPKTEAGPLERDDRRRPLLHQQRLQRDEQATAKGASASSPRFTAPNPVNNGEIVGFDGMGPTSA